MRHKTCFSLIVLFCIIYSFAWAATVNDVHSQLNATEVADIVQPRSIEDIQAAIRRARQEGRAVSIAGGRHAMGGQQFGKGTLLLDMSEMKKVIRFDAKKGRVEAEAGIQWPDLIDYLLSVQKKETKQWGIHQKQTGANNMTLGGALSANIHGRGLKLRPIIEDVESFVLVDAEGSAKKCSREENGELFRLAIGGYGLFGVIATVELRLAPRVKLERVVTMQDAKTLMDAFNDRIAKGFDYGDFQFSVDETSEDFLTRGILSCYRTVAPQTPLPEHQKELGNEEWKRLIYLAHQDKKEAFSLYTKHYLATSGQIYWSDLHQLSTYAENYHRAVDQASGAVSPGSEMITEIYVPREKLYDFLKDARRDFIENNVRLIYGTIRLIEEDGESFLAWAKNPYACTIFNLHADHDKASLEKAARDFRRLIDLAQKYEGSYYLTYHRYATREQVEKSYPQFRRFLELKRKYDPQEVFQSDWYRHYREMFGRGPA